MSGFSMTSPAIIIIVILHHTTTSYTHQGVTEESQRMWDPGSGSLLGQEHLDHLGLENITITNQTAQLGTTTFLHCPVRNIHHKQVTWIRRRDYHLLTSGLHVYSRDERFSVVHQEDSNDWALQIKFVQHRDQGEYECQVSTVTGRYGYLINLSVVVPQAAIIGSPERHIQSGSTISLTCVILRGVTSPQYILWHHNNDMVNYDKSRDDTNITMVNTNSSRLTINSASSQHSGNYTCSAANILPSTVHIFITKGDKTAAIQRFGSGGSGLHVMPSGVLLVISHLFTLVFWMLSLKRLLPRRFYLSLFGNT